MSKGKRGNQKNAQQQNKKASIRAVLKPYHRCISILHHHKQI